MQLTPDEVGIVVAALRFTCMEFHDRGHGAEKKGKYAEAQQMLSFAYVCQDIQGRLDRELKKVDRGLLVPLMN